MAVEAAHEQGLDVFLHAQVHALASTNATAEGEVLLEADIEHRRMTLA